MSAFREMLHIRIFVDGIGDMTYSGIKIFSFFHFQIYISSHSSTTMVIAQTKDARTFDMTCTPYHRSAGKQKGDAIIAVGLRFACP